MNMIDLINELNKRAKGIASFSPFSVDYVRIRIQNDSSNADIIIPCCYEKIINDAVAKQKFIESLINDVSKIRSILVKTETIINVCNA